MVPVDPICIPDGYEAVGLRIAKAGEEIAKRHSNGNSWPAKLRSDSDFPELVIRKKYNPGIRINRGWWVWTDGEDWGASKKPGEWEDAICGLQHLPEFIPTPDCQPQQVN